MGADDDKLGGRVSDCEIDEDRLLSVSRAGVSLKGSTDRVLESDKGRKKDIVRDRFKAGFSSLSGFSSKGVGFLTSGSLYSSFPFLSDA